MKKLVAFILPTPVIPFNKGTHNGYVAIPPEHPLYGKYVSVDALDKLDVHGGITLTEAVIMPEERYGLKVNPKYIGKRNPLLDDAEYITDEKDIPDDWWILGFDTCHYLDNSDTWDKDAVIRETLRLKEQLDEIANGKQLKGE